MQENTVIHLYCGYCHGLTGRTVAFPATTATYTCKRCGKMHLGAPESCKSCGVQFNVNRFRVAPIYAGLKLVDEHPCDACKIEIDSMTEIIKKGGVLYQCNNCNSRGAIRACEEALRLKREKGLADDDLLIVNTEKCISCDNGG